MSHHNPQPMLPRTLARSNAGWTRRIRAGDERAFAWAVSAFQLELVSAVRSVVGSYEVAEEIVQDTFLELWNHRRHVRVAATLRAQLYRIARRLVREYVKRTSGEAAIRQQAVERGAHSREPAPSAPADAELALEELRVTIARILKRLPSACHLVFHLSREQRLSHAEIARATGMPIRAVEMHMTKALSMLRTGLASWRD